MSQGNDPVPSLLSRNEVLAITVKNYSEADIKVF